MEQPRTPADLCSWVEAKGRELSSSREAKAYARSRSWLPKKFFDELLPLAVYVSRRYAARSDVLVAPDLGNDNFDARILISGEAAQFVEITYAKDGHDEALRFEVLTRDGHVNAFAPITIVRRKGRERDVSIPNEAVAHEEILTANLDLVASRLKGKANVAYGARHTLVLAVDDYIPFHDQDDAERLDRLVRHCISKLSLDFGELVVLGVSGRLVLTYPLERQRSNDPLQRTGAASTVSSAPAAEGQR